MVTSWAASPPTRARTLAVLVTAQLCALAGAVVVAVVAGGDPTGGDYALGALGGVLNVAALGCLYQGLAVGRAGLVAPVAAVIGAVIPVVWGLATGESPATAALIGVALAIVAGGLISMERDEHPSDAANRTAVAAARARRRRRLRLLVRLLRQHPRRVRVLAGALGPGRRRDSRCSLVVAVTRTHVRARRRRPRVQAIAAGAARRRRHHAPARRHPRRPVRHGRARRRAGAGVHRRPTPGGTCASDRRRIQLAGLVLALTGLVLIAAG